MKPLLTGLGSTRIFPVVSAVSAPWPSAAVLGAAVLLVTGGHATAQDKQALIESALSAAPTMVAQTATVKDHKGNVLKEGSGEFTCFPREGAGQSPMCIDEAWAGWLDAYMNKKPFTASEVGVSYMLAGDAPDGGASNIDPYAKEPAADNQWIVEGPHVMVLVADAALLEAFPAEPGSGDPYVMWKGTPYAHVMVPTGARPEQRATAQ
jgi:hypothetical protein